MLVRKWFASTLVLTALVSMADRAWSEEATSPEDIARARTLHEEATTNYNLGRFREALDAFSAAYELYPSAAFLFNSHGNHFDGGLRKALVNLNLLQLIQRVPSPLQLGQLIAQRRIGRQPLLDLARGLVVQLAVKVGDQLLVCRHGAFRQVGVVRIVVHGIKASRGTNQFEGVSSCKSG